MKKYFLSALMLMGLSATAQTITFEADDFANIGVYDSWEQSPFRTGKLEGNVAVVNNHLNQVDEVLGAAPNESAKMLAFQRSRYAGNLYGARIDLKEPFRLTKEMRYVHVMINKPVESRVMVIGLGKRTEADWSWQSKEVEQFMAITNLTIGANGWVDAVAGFKGFSYADPEKDGIEIYSLVIVPDVRTAHADAEDFACYIDEIVIDDSNQPRFSTEKYAVSFDRESSLARTDRYMTSVGLNGGTLSPQTAALDKTHNYYDLTTKAVFSAKAGQTVTPTYGYGGSWMHTFTYVDFGNDGKFTAEINADGTPTAESDMVSYQFAEIDGVKYNSLGEHPSGGNLISQPSPAFTLPEGLANGFYRMRYKVDWNDFDAAGSVKSGNAILGNGGGIVDVMLDVHGDEVKVGQGALNGAVVDAEGNQLDNYKVAYGQPFAIKMAPEDGFTYDGIRVKSGYNVAGDQFDKNGNAQYIITEFSWKQFDENDCFTLPANVMIGDEVNIEGIFVEGSHEPIVEPEKEASFPLVSPTPIEGQWVKGTKSYHIQNGANEGAWISLNNAREEGLRLDANEEPEDQEGEWVVCGNDEDGYSFYNVAAGPTQVLGLTGDDKYARVKLYELGQEGTATIRFDYCESEGGFSFRLHGTANNCLNSRDQWLALWNNSNALSNDRGSRFTFYEAADIEGIDPTPAPVEYGPVLLSTAKAQYPYYIHNLGAPDGGSPGHDVYVKYDEAHAGTFNSLFHVATIDDEPDQFEFYEGEDESVYIYDATIKQYVTWTSTNEGGINWGSHTLTKCSVTLTADKKEAKTWYIIDDENTEDRYDIVPEASCSNGWSFMGGTDQDFVVLNLEGKTGRNMKWLFEAVKEQGGVVGMNTVLSPAVSDRIYNLQGQQMGRLVKGINIVGGRKVLKK